MSTFFTLDIVDVGTTVNDNITSENLTNFSSADNLITQLCETLDCQPEELNFEDAYFEAQEDFLISLVGIDDGKVITLDNIEDSIFDNISTIENKDISLDVWEVAVGLIGDKDFDNVERQVEKYIGEYKSTADFAEYYCEDYMETDIPSTLQGCIDWERVWESSLRHDISEYNGYYFND